MRTFLALLLSGTLATGANAETIWHFIAGNSPDLEGTRISFFYDPTTLTAPSEDTRRVVILGEFIAGAQSAMTFGESEVSDITFDCQISRVRPERTDWYEFAQARGAITKTFGRSDWRPLYSDVMRTVRSVICSLPVNVS